MTGVANHLVLFWIPASGFPAIEILKLRALLRTAADPEHGGSELLIKEVRSGMAPLPGNA